MSNRPTGGPAFPVPGFEFLDDRDPTKPERVVNLPAPGMTCATTSPPRRCRARSLTQASTQQTTKVTSPGGATKWPTQ